MCAVLLLERGSLSQDGLQFSNQIKRKALFDTVFCDNALPELLLNDLNLFHQKAQL